jgi:glycosyltransferase involved in cell wall biosynthesis
MKKKVIIFSNYDDISNPYYGGGGALAVHEVAKRLVKQGRYQVIAITGKYPKSRDEVVEGVQYQRIGIKKFGPKVGQFCYLLCLPFVVLNKNFDVWMECFTPPFSTSFLPLLTKKPIVGVTHFLMAKEKEKEYFLPFSVVEKFGMKKYKYFIALTNRVKEYILEQNPTAIVSIIPNGMILKKIKIVKPPKEKYILFIGRIEKRQKGVDLLLEAFSKAAAETTLKLFIAGNGAPKEVSWLKEEISRSNLGDRITLLGRVDGEAKTRLFTNAEFVVLPSRFETLCMTALETLSLRKPLVCFDIPGISWLDEKLAWKIPAFDTEKLAHAMIQMSNSKRTRQQFSKSSDTFARLYSWDNIVKKYQEMIEKVT